VLTARPSPGPATGQSPHGWFSKTGSSTEPVTKPRTVAKIYNRSVARASDRPVTGSGDGALATSLVSKRKLHGPSPTQDRLRHQPRCPDPSTDPAAWEPAQPVQAAHTGLALPPKVSTFGGTEPYHSSRASNSARRTCPPPEPSRSSSSRVETIQPHLQAKGLSAVVAARLCRNM
jgi:hypothetical protein